MKVNTIVPILLLLGAALTGSAGANPLESVPAPVVVSSLPAVALSGESVDIGTQKGWRVVYFWSQECPCVRDCERLSLVRLAKKYTGKVAFYAVESNAPDIRGNRQVLAANIAIHALPYPVLLDPDHKIADALQGVSTPQSFLISPDNHVVFQGAPDDSPQYKARTGVPGFNQAYLAEALAQALAGKTVVRPAVKTFGCGIVRE